MEVPCQVPPEHQLFGRYRLLTKIASGGMGEIYLARLEGEGGFAKLLVIKRLLPALVASEEFRTMFVNEARITAQLSHPNICDIYELGQVGPQYFLAMQYLQGVPVSRIARADRPVDREHVRLVAGLVAQACAGLHHAHELADSSGNKHHIVHRDVSPSNLLATFDGIVNVLDFGIATMQGVPRMTSKGSIRGKFAYMSPEQISGKPLDRRSDLFSLGVVMFETLTRKRLFDRPSEFLVAKAILEEEYPDPVSIASAIPDTLAATVVRALARRPSDRFQTAKDMAAAIRAAMSSHGGVMGPAEIGEHLRIEFAEELALQRGQYEDATGSFERVLSEDTESLAAPVPVATVATRALRGPAAEPATESAGPSHTWRRRRGLIAAVAVAVSVLAAILTVGLLRRTAGTTAPDAGIAVTRAPAVDAAAAPPVTRRAAAPAGADASPPRIDEAPDAGARRAKSKQTERPGFLNIDSFPFATIHVDGRRIDVTPIPKLELAPGIHRVRATLADGRTRRFKVRVRSGKITRRRVDDW